MPKVSFRMASASHRVSRKTHPVSCRGDRASADYGVQQRAELIRGGVDALGVLMALLAADLAIGAQELGEARDHEERRAQVVTKAAQRLVVEADQLVVAAHGAAASMA